MRKIIISLFIISLLVTFISAYKKYGDKDKDDKDKDDYDKDKSNFKSKNDTTRWSPAKKGYIPYNSLQVGHYQDKKLYFARSYIHDGLHIGYIAKGENKARIPYGGEVKSVDQYQVLVGNMKNIKWVEAKDGQLRDKTIKGGYQNDGSILYIGRGELNGDLIPGKILPKLGSLNVPYESKEIGLSIYQLLTFSQEEYDYQELFYQKEFDKYEMSEIQKSLDEKDEYQSQNVIFKAVTIALSIAVVVMAILIVVMICLLKRKSKQIEREIITCNNDHSKNFNAEIRSHDQLEKL